MQAINISALQIETSLQGTEATLGHILDYENDIKNSNSFLVVAPEASLGAYPKGSGFGTFVGYRTPQGREEFRKYYSEAIEVPGKETKELEALSRRTGARLVIGVIERWRSSLFCTALTFTPEEGLVSRRRKLMPTASERLIWGQGDGSTLSPVETPHGRINAAICWENYMPLLRTAFYGKGVEFWCAPTVDDREVWRSSMRHIALEGRCFVLSACQYKPSPSQLGFEAEGWPSDKPLIEGGTMIVGPMGDVLAGPLIGKPGLVTASVDPQDIVRARYDFDVVGHYSRSDIFELKVDETPRPGVAFTASAKSADAATPKLEESEGK